MNTIVTDVHKYVEELRKGYNPVPFGEYVKLYLPRLNLIDMEAYEPCRINFLSFMPSSLEEVKEFSENLKAAIEEAEKINQHLVSIDGLS